MRHIETMTNTKRAKKTRRPDLTAVCIALPLLLAAGCDVALDETCDTTECEVVLVVPLPVGVQSAELRRVGGRVIQIDCIPGVPCEEVELRWPSDDGKPSGLTLHADGRAWRVNVGDLVPTEMCTRQCTKNYPSTLELLSTKPRAGTEQDGLQIADRYPVLRP